MENLFVYGTLREPGVQREVIGRTVDGSPDTLEGFATSEVVIEGETYPILVLKKNCSVDGLVLSLTSEELRHIDEYETEAYRRERVVLESGENAWVYMK